MSCPTACTGKCTKDFCVMDTECNDVSSKSPKLTEFGVRLQPFLSNLWGEKTKQGLEKLTKSYCQHYNDPVGPEKIKKFIKDYGIEWKDAKKCKDDTNIDECAKEFNTINDFFTRELKQGIRPIAIDNQNCLTKELADCYNDVVSPADSQVVVYDTLGDAKNIWIKGESFTIKELLKKKTDKYYNYKLAIFYLTPSDYHRFHSPITGVIKKIVFIKGAYYSVNSTVIHKNLDVYGQNHRVILYLYNEVLGKIPMVIIGSTCVGSIALHQDILKTVYEYTGQYVQLTNIIEMFRKNVNSKTLSLNIEFPIRYGQELGHFQFGGSTIILLFDPGQFNFCKGLLTTSKNNTATVMKYGQFVGSFNEPLETQ